MEDQLYLEIGFGEQANILKYIKKHSDLNWSEIAQSLGVKKRMVFFYLEEKSRLPMYRLMRLCEQTGFDLSGLKLNTISMKNFEQKPIRKPKLNEELAEFLGALSGDGNVDPNNNRVSIGCDVITDFEYVTDLIKGKFTKLFNTETTIKVQNGTIYCQVYSKDLADYLEELGFPKGNRKNRTNIPQTIVKNKKFLIAFLRGVFDTDGSFHRKRETSAVVEYISCSPLFLLQIKESLIKLGLRASLSGKSVYIYSQDDVETFFKVVKPNNSKHCIKYKIFKETGKVPLHKEFVQAFVM